MARKIVYGIEIESTDAQGSIKRVEERLQELNQTADASQREIKTLSQELKELGQTRTDQTENINSVQSLRRAYRELIEELQRTEEGTERFAELAQAAGEVKNQIDAAQDSVNNFNKSPFENLRNNFRQLRQRIVDLDIDGFKQDFRDLGTNFRLAGQSLIGIQKGAGIAANGLKIFRAAVIGTGVGLLVIGITTLINNFDTLKESGGVLGSVFTFLGNLIDNTQIAILKLSDAIGLTNKAYDKYIEKQNEANKSSKETGEIVETIEEKFKRLQKEAVDKSLTQFQKSIILTNQNVQDLDGFIQELDKNILSLQFQIGNAENKLLRLKDAQERTNKSGQASLEITASQNQNIQKQEKLIKDLTAQYVKISDERVEVTKTNTLLLRNFNAEAEAELQKISLKNLEDREKAELTRLNTKIVNELEAGKDINEIQENFDKEKTNIEIKFLNERLLRFKELGLDIIALELEASNKNVEITKNQVDKQLAERQRLVDEAFKITPDAVSAPTLEDTRKQDIDNANKKIDLIGKEINFRKELNKLTLETGDAEIKNIEQSILFADERLKILEEYGLKELELYQDIINEKKLLEAELTKTKEEQNQKRLDDEAKTLEESKQLNLQTASDVLNIASTLSNGVTDLVNQRYDYEIRKAGDNQEEIEKIQKEQFETNKALGIVNAIISTAQGITNALGTSGPPWVGIAMAAVVGALGAAQVALIASQEFTPGSSAGASGFNANAAGSQSLGNVSSMQPNINFAAAGSGANVQTAGGGTQQSIDFTGSISVSEINDVQNLVNVYETSSIIGGG
jgi:hypothetical protein